MFRWASRCLPGFTIIALVTLLAFTSNSISSPWTGIWPPATEPPSSGESPSLNVAQEIFMVYTVLVHTNMLAFAVRLSCSLWYATRKTKEVLKRRIRQSRPPSRENSTDGFVDAPVSPTQNLPDPSVFKLNDPTVYEVDDAEVVHAIILPNYGEDLHTLRTTLNVLSSHPRARSQYEVYLAMEQKETDARDKAAKLISTFEKSFLAIRSTFHPAGLQGEIAGKSSNVAFAARHIVQVHRTELSAGSCNVIATVMDADTHLWKDYFTEIRRLHYAHPDKADRTLYACPIIFDRNSHKSPILVRCADLLWGFAGLSTMYPGTAISIPTSVYSLPLSLADKVGGWDSDPTAIGEDMHMLLKCYFETAGNLVSRVIHVPASQCNVSGDSSSSSSSSNTWGKKIPWHRQTLDTYQARYRQALRHMWGALDSGFATRRTVSYLRLHSRCLFLRPRHLALLHLLWEAHFLPVHLFILMVFSAVYEMTITSSALHPALRSAFLITAILRTVSFVWMNVCLALYERWHALCLNTRRADMLHANVSDTGFSGRVWWHVGFLLERVCFPIAGTVFGAVPTLHAVFAHFWTDRLVYRVSRKPDFGASIV